LGITAGDVIEAKLVLRYLVAFTAGIVVPKYRTDHSTPIQLRPAAPEDIVGSMRIPVQNDTDVGATKKTIGA
jgi:hypothetical protein